MSYVLGGSTIRTPNKITMEVSKQFAQQRTLDNTIARDFFGDLKHVWTLEYKGVNKTDYDVIYNLFATYLANDTALAWQSTEANNPITSTYVHVDLPPRVFSVSGADYLSDFSVKLTEA